MNIASIQAYTLRAPLTHPFSFSQWTFTHRETTLARVQTAGGLVGWGEGYGPAAQVAAALREFFAPLATGSSAGDTEALWARLYARSIDYGQKGVMLAALSALDIACWDIKARAAGLPLYRLLGGGETESIACYATGFYPAADPEREFPAEAERYLNEGFRAVKMKVGFGVERDAALVALVRRAAGPGVRLMVDANHAYDPVSAIALARRIEPHGIGWFEEPTSPLDVEGYLEVKRATTIPLAGGECEYTRFGFEPWLRRRAFDYAQPDLCATGGISEGMKIAALASVYQVHVTPHAWGSAVGQAAALHFYAARPRHPASTTPEEKLIECDRTENPFRTAIVREPVRFHQGCWFLPSGPGLGVEVDELSLQQYL